jgi:hypothetical protein
MGFSMNSSVVTSLYERQNPPSTQAQVVSQTAQPGQVGQTGQTATPQQSALAQNQAARKRQSISRIGANKSIFTGLANDRR